LKSKKIFYKETWECQIFNNLNLHEVEYIIYDDHIVFSGLHNGKDGPRLSTINGAERIVTAIAKAEGIDPKKYTFYDLQTFKSYGDYRQGDYNFNRLTIDWQGGNRPYVLSWTEGHCLPEILEDFGHLIWGEGERSIPRHMAVHHGALLPQVPEPKELKAPS